MKAEGTHFVRPAVPTSIKRAPAGASHRWRVTWTETSTTNSSTSSSTQHADFDTVLAATGRVAATAGLGLTAAGVTVGAGGKIVTENEATSVPGVFAIGDAVQDFPELTPGTYYYL
jgi:pyruvate/2-oxoglutarate dehydrogenase complex dihydrolipoamide dehydrogenase (E3) component